MTKQEFMAMSLPYGLKIIHDDNEVETISALGDSFQYQISGRSFAYGWYGETFDCTPILHPLSDLTKEIEHKGEKFVPIMELAKFLYKRVSIAESFKLRGDRVYFESISYNHFWYSKDMRCFCSMFENSDIPVPVHNQLELFQQLFKWHFDLFGGIESGEAIDVNTLDINPYK